MKQQDQPIAIFDRVTKRYRRLRAVDEVTFSIAPGEVVGLVGDYESGKTTLMSMIMGFSRPSKGTIELFGHKVTSLTAHRVHRDIAYAAFDTTLPHIMTGERYLRAVMAHRAAPAKQYDQLVRAFRPQLESKIGTLSSSNRQKIVLISAFLGLPKLIVLDEPMRELDPLSREVLLDTMRDASLRGATVVVSSQYPDEVARSCSRIIMLKDGAVVHDLSQQQITEYKGKNVTLYSDADIKLPLHAAKIRTGSQRKIKFSYTGDTQQLLQWISELKGIEDIAIEPRSLNDEFRHLYVTPEESDGE